MLSTKNNIVIDDRVTVNTKPQLETLLRKMPARMYNRQLDEKHFL